MAMSSHLGQRAAEPPRHPSRGLLLIALTKPRVTALVLFTFAFGVLIAPGRGSPALVMAAALGTSLVVGAANVLNMWWERDTDARMARTRARPLASGALSPRAALVFGATLFGLSVPLLAAANLRVLALGLVAFGTYVFLYTPLKRRTWHSLSIGAIAGAAPPLMGWVAVTGTLDLGGAALFLVLFVWQLPHSTAISLFRAEEYAGAGLCVCATELGAGRAKRVTIAASVVLVGLTYLPYHLGLGGAKYALVALALGAALLAVELRGAPSDAAWGRRVFGASIAYQVALFGALWLDRA